MTILYGNRTLRIRKNLILFFMYFFIWSFQNHIPLKPIAELVILLSGLQPYASQICLSIFWAVLRLVYHIKLHTSQTETRVIIEQKRLVYHIKLHTSQTINHIYGRYGLLVYHIKLHTSQTALFDAPQAYTLVYHTKLHTSQTIWQAAAISPHACLP